MILNCFNAMPQIQYISTIFTISYQHQVAPFLHICPPGCPSPCCSRPAAARSDSPTSPLTWPWRWIWWKLWLDRFLDKTWPSPRWKLWSASKLTCSITFCFTFCAFPPKPQCLQKPNRNHTFPGSQVQSSRLCGRTTLILPLAFNIRHQHQQLHRHLHLPQH